MEQNPQSESCFWFNLKLPQRRQKDSVMASLAGPCSPQEGDTMPPAPLTTVCTQAGWLHPHLLHHPPSPGGVLGEGSEGGPTEKQVVHSFFPGKGILGCLTAQNKRMYCLCVTMEMSSNIVSLFSLFSKFKNTSKRFQRHFLGQL